jgi:hypothetical protein
LSGIAVSFSIVNFCWDHEVSCRYHLVSLSIIIFQYICRFSQPLLRKLLSFVRFCGYCKALWRFKNHLDDSSPNGDFLAPNCFGIISLKPGVVQYTVFYRVLCAYKYSAHLNFTMIFGKHFFKNNVTRINHCMFIHHKSHLKPFLSYLPCIVHREYFSIIFNVKKCTLYSIKYGNLQKYHRKTHDTKNLNGIARKVIFLGFQAYLHTSPIPH